MLIIILNNVQSSYETKKNLWKNNEANAYKQMSDGQMYSFSQLFFITEKISLNWRLDSTVTDYVLLIFIVMPLWWVMGLLKYMSIRHKIRKKRSCSLAEYCFFFWRKIYPFDWGYWRLSLKCKISAIWLVETACTFLIFLIATIQISMECENAGKRGGIYETSEFALT